jgi:2-methylfumaryl-CoA isomerase
VQHPTYGPFKIPAWPVRIDGKPPSVRPSPTLGQHTAEVLGAWLGMGAADIEGLRRDGAL